MPTHIPASEIDPVELVLLRLRGRAAAARRRHRPLRAEALHAGLPVVIASALMFAWGRTPAELTAARVVMGVGTSCDLIAPLALYASASRPAALVVREPAPPAPEHRETLAQSILGIRTAMRMTLLNMGSMGGVFVTQSVTGLAIDLFPATDGLYPLASYRLVFALQAAFLVVTAALYLTARDPLRDSPRPEGSQG